MDKSRDSEAPLCEGGCGKRVTWNRRKRKWNRFIKGHQWENTTPSIETRKKQSLARKGKYARENSPSWKGGFYINKKGIKIINIPDRGDILESRLIVEKVLERYLTSSEVVHHIDENQSNNANNNLLVCNKAYHLLLHRKMNPIVYMPFGVKQSEKTKEKRAKKLWKPVLVAGIKYRSVKEAIEKSKISFLTIRKRILQQIEGYSYFKKELI